MCERKDRNKEDYMSDGWIRMYRDKMKRKGKRQKTRRRVIT